MFKNVSSMHHKSSTSHARKERRKHLQWKSNDKIQICVRNTVREIGINTSTSLSSSNYAQKFACSRFDPSQLKLKVKSWSHVIGNLDKRVSSRLDSSKKPLKIPLESEQTVTTSPNSKSVDEILASLRISTDIMQPLFPHITQPEEIRRYNPNRIVEFESDTEARGSKRLSNNPIRNRKKESKAEGRLDSGKRRYEVKSIRTVNYLDYINRTFNKVETDHATDSEEAVDVICNMEDLN